jgi:hypothetical protein
LKERDFTVTPVPFCTPDFTSLGWRVGNAASVLTEAADVVSAAFLTEAALTARAFDNPPLSPVMNMQSTHRKAINLFILFFIGILSPKSQISFISNINVSQISNLKSQFI